ncbi:hypothetical protein R1flu_016049 [Riccia fluitans]|uniref:Uncharacterized protein n=1 Tax=Riccia fluitans TaxID=41844 RepID=A0ABD1YKW7_9MARC
MMASIKDENDLEKGPNHPLLEQADGNVEPGNVEDNVANGCFFAKGSSREEDVNMHLNVSHCTVEPRNAERVERSADGEVHRVTVTVKANEKFFERVQEFHLVNRESLHLLNTGEIKSKRPRISTIRSITT